MSQRAINLLLAAAVAALLATAHLLDGPNQHQEQIDQVLATNDAVAQAALEDRLGIAIKPPEVKP